MDQGALSYDTHTLIRVPASLFRIKPAPSIWQPFRYLKAVAITPNFLSPLFLSKLGLEKSPYFRGCCYITLLLRHSGRRSFSFIPWKSRVLGGGLEGKKDFDLIFGDARPTLFSAWQLLQRPWCRQWFIWSFLSMWRQMIIFKMFQQILALLDFTHPWKTGWV